jgi:hypothetical protein
MIASPQEEALSERNVEENSLVSGVEDYIIPG